jgi:hypothetical protein
MKLQNYALVLLRYFSVILQWRKNTQKLTH